MFLNDKGTTQKRVTIILPDKKESQTDRMNEKNYNNFFVRKSNWDRNFCRRP